MIEKQTELSGHDGEEEEDDDDFDSKIVECLELITAQTELLILQNQALIESIPKAKEIFKNTLNKLKMETAKEPEIKH